LVYLTGLAARLGFIEANAAARVEILGGRAAAALAGLKKSIRASRP
jgi:hypothetical protein